MGNNNKLSGIVGFIFNTRGLKKRDFGIDFIKSIAALFVLSVHFFLKNGYYNIPMTERNIMHSRGLFYIADFIIFVKNDSQNGRRQQQLHSIFKNRRLKHQLPELEYGLS